jgi:hypothetical protein
MLDWNGVTPVMGAVTAYLRGHLPRACITSLLRAPAALQPPEVFLPEIVSHVFLTFFHTAGGRALYDGGLAAVRLAEVLREDLLDADGVEVNASFQEEVL